MKKKMLTIACLAGILSLGVYSAQAEISQKTLQSFRSVFAEAKHVQWTEYADHYYVSFSQNDMLIKANYDKEGNLLSTTRYYKEQRLPLNVLYAVKKSYPSQTINNVTEVSSPDGTVYFIKMMDAKSWTTVKSDVSGNMEVTEKFDRAE